MADVNKQFQSTHPHGVRPTITSATVQPIIVSIHAPARGATTLKVEYCIYNKVSIHAPARGATRPAAERSIDQHSFNPRTRTGCDANPACPCAGSFVSIHAPARGATVNASLEFPVQIVSIHAPARGATKLT